MRLLPPPHFAAEETESESNFAKATERGGNQIQLTPDPRLLKMFLLSQAISHFYNPCTENI